MRFRIYIIKNAGSLEMSEKFSSVLVNFIIRAVIGVAIIFFFNQFLSEKNIEASVGINPVTIVTSGTLGVPGVALLYGISFYSGM